MTRKEKKLIDAYNTEIEYIASELMSLVNNAVVINGMPDHIPQEVVKRWLLLHGQVAAFSPTGNDADLHVWKADPAGIDFYGLPTRYSLIGDAGASYLAEGRDLDRLTRIRANTEALPLFPKLYRYARRLVEAQKSIDLNLEATRNAGIIVANKENADAVRRAYEKTKSGIPVVIELDSKVALAENVRYTGTTVPYMVDRLRQYFTELRDEILVEAGILTANRDKRERVQSAEVSAGAFECFDYLGRLVDQFNRDAAPLGWSMEYNTTLNECIDDGAPVDDMVYVGGDNE
jgi:hypothetical protein